MKPAFLTRPLDWTRASRGSADPIAYACAVSHSRQPWRMADFIRAVVCVAGCAVIAILIARGSF